MSDSSTFDELLERYGEIANINAARAMMAWDQETYMPDGSQQARAQQMATLSAIAHQRFTCDEMRRLLERLRGDEVPEDKDQRTAVERVVWDFERATKIPEKLVREIARAQSDSVACWTRARPGNDFKTWLPHLERVLDLERRKADYLARDGQSRYDALLEGYERGATAQEIEVLFNELRGVLVPLLERIMDSPNPVSTDCIDRDFDPDRQWQFGLEVLRAMGFDFSTGRQDRSAHPFTTSFHPTDVRITTRVFADNLCSALFGTVHEGGHALYDQGLSPDDWRTPLGETVSLGIHESQSRMWENIVGRGRAFWKHFYPQIQRVFPAELGQVGEEDFYRAINRVRPSLIRVEADEVTYSLHIILRFEIETALLEGTLAPADLPEAWREKMREYLDLDVPDDKDGCMQDIHWAWGLVGYFPTYTLGNLCAAGFYAQALRDVPDLEERIARGQLRVLREWLREKIHRRGLRRLAPELYADVTGQALEARPFIDYLTAKFSKIYRLG